MRRKESERRLPAENGSWQRELQPIFGRNYAEFGASKAFGESN